MYYTTQHKVLMRIFRLSERFPQAHNSAQCSLFGMDPLERASIVYTCTCMYITGRLGRDGGGKDALSVICNVTHTYISLPLSTQSREKIELFRTSVALSLSKIKRTILQAIDQKLRQFFFRQYCRGVHTIQYNGRVQLVQII